MCGVASFGQIPTSAPAATPAAALQPIAAAPQPATLTSVPVASLAPEILFDGTPIKLRLAENLTSATAKTGQQVSFEVIEDIRVQGVLVLAKGALALATVTDANRKKSMGRGGKLDVNVNSARLVDGESVQLRAVQDNKGGGHVGAMTGAMVATAIVFFPAAPLFLFIKGKDVTIPEGTPVTAFVQGDMRLDMAKFGAAPAAGTTVSSSLSATSGLTVEANVPNCDIEVDGSFMGSTPSTLQLAPGKHEVVVKKAGYQDWTRSMLVGSGSVRMSAEMVAVRY